jgi:hypothetical protein
MVKMIMEGHLRNLLMVLLKLNQSVFNSVLDIPFHSTTPYSFGDNVAVKWHLIPTSSYKSPKYDGAKKEHYLIDAMATHLKAEEATFDFCVQFQKGNGMPIDNSSVVWKESKSPYIKIASLRIPKQEFTQPERYELGEELSFSPGHTIPEHKPLGSVNRVRLGVYKGLQAVRHERDSRKNLE